MCNVNRIIGIRNTGVVDYLKKKTIGSRVSCRASKTCQNARMARRGDESDVSALFQFLVLSLFYDVCEMWSPTVFSF